MKLVWQTEVEVRKVGKGESDRCARYILPLSSLRNDSSGTTEELRPQTSPGPLTNSFPAKEKKTNQTLGILTGPSVQRKGSEGVNKKREPP